MSPSAFHLHFKGVTGLSPLQYLKRLRHQEARRLMLGGGLDAAKAAFRVGYESPSQFSREYRRMFGAPPRQDVTSPKVEAQPASFSDA
jgi:AraC-like DNA-binding protein